MPQWETLIGVQAVLTHQMIMKKGTAKASDVMLWTRDCSEPGKVLTVLGTTSQLVLKLVNGPQAFEEGMLPGHTEQGAQVRCAPRLRVLPFTPMGFVNSNPRGTA